MVAKGMSADRLGEYATYIRRWESCCLEHWTATPGLQEISPLTLEDYRSYLVDSLKVPVGAADKHVQGVSALLKWAADDWIIERVPRVRKTDTKARQGLKWVFSAADIDALYAACDGVEWPAKFRDGTPCENGADYWRLFLVAGWNFGPRVQEWWACESDTAPIAWGGVIWDRMAEIEGRSVRSSHGWAQWTATKTGHRFTLPLHTVVRSHLERVYHALPADRRDPDRPVFDFPLSRGTKRPGRPLSPADGWYAAWWDLVRRAGFRPKKGKDGRHRTHRPGQLRKTAHTLHRDNVIEVDGRTVRVGEIADFVTGHSGGRNVSLRHYYRSVDAVIATCESLRQPASFAGKSEG